MNNDKNSIYIINNKYYEGDTFLGQPTEYRIKRDEEAKQQLIDFKKRLRFEFIGIFIFSILITIFYIFFIL